MCFPGFILTFRLQMATLPILSLGIGVKHLLTFRTVIYQNDRCKWLKILCSPWSCTTSVQIWKPPLQSRTECCSILIAVTHRWSCFLPSYIGLIRRLSKFLGGHPESLAPHWVPLFVLLFAGENPRGMMIAQGAQRISWSLHAEAGVTSHWAVVSLGPAK